MAIRTTAGDSAGIPSGYAGNNIPDDYTIPECTIEDADRALHDLFNKQMNIQVSLGKQTGNKKVPVIFAAGESWAILKQGKPMRDREGTLVLPLIAIHRKSIKQDLAKDITGRGINQQTGELVIKRKLSLEDREYQNLINKMGIPNQDNLGNSGGIIEHKLSAEDSLINDSGNKEGGWLQPDYHKNVWEFITIPSPQFYTATYEVTIWGQYLQQMNEIIQQIMSSYLPQGQCFRIETQDGYWFIATLESNSYDIEDNLDNVDAERLLKCKISIDVAGYLIGSEVGKPAIVRKFISAPIIDFSMDIGESSEDSNAVSGEFNETKENDPTSGFFLGGESIPATADNQPGELVVQDITKNPFNNHERVRYVRVSKRNKKVGETILKPYNLPNGITYKITR